MPEKPKNDSKKRARQSDDEALFLRGIDPNAYERLSVAVDVVLLSVFDEDLHTILTRRREHPYKDRLALPGGFVRLPESLDDTAARLLRDKLGLTNVFLEQLSTFGDPKRDPRMRVISVAYYALVEKARFLAQGERGDAVVIARLRAPKSGKTGGAVEVLDASGKVLPIAFDHAEILGLAVKRLLGSMSSRKSTRP
ncbi:MAG TPA: NUDIX domain-containing protein [Polyangia bacterium]|jgi:8-oxo-dGTP diphosphatase|nr:NUDIX domain-containing protein [Polyangia bacterium]